MANKTETADVVVLGAGPAGYPCAIRLAQLGKKVTVVERQYVGGVCLNVGCIPSKALIYAGTMYEKMANHGSEFGIEAKGVTANLSKMMKFKEGVVSKLTGGVGQLLKANGCTVISGDAKLTGPKSMEIKSGSDTVTLNFSQLVIATGSRPSKLPGFDVDQKQIVDSTGALALKEIPGKMLCIGGGYIGLELGTFYAKVGTQVTVVEAMGNLLSGVDPDLTKVVARRLEKLGVKVLLNTKVKGQKAGKKGVEVTFTADGKDKTETFDVVLVTIGRAPNSDGLGLDKAGIKLDPKGFIPVDAQRRTNVPNIYAIGDIAGQPLLAHKGTKEGLVAAEAIAGKKVAYDVVAMPAVIFTDPEVATVGLTEAEARAKGLDAKVTQFPFVANGRALSVGEPDGMVKMISDGKSGRLLGVHIVGAEASNLIAEATLAIEMGAHVEDLALTVHAHPTLPEVLMETAETALGHPIHIFQRKAGASPGAQAARAH
ncbi:MAG TPA: dihydrolipoyl dehydrogenase [Bdellovibrionota bacterium]|nr:dihydrolipoyl dehydrogenase [Bdellovibrionota bacterium]